MSGIILTRQSGILSPIAWLLGKILEGIFLVIDFIGIPNIGLAIFLFTIVVYLLMLPLTIKMQRFSKLSAKLTPEIDAVRKKYENKKDQESQMAMNQEIQAVYAKYGVSPMGSCVQLLIQMPILFALYRVIYSIPAYVGKIHDTFAVLANRIIELDGADFLQNSGVDTIANTVTTYGRNISESNLVNGVIDVLNRLSSMDMATISEHYGLADLTYQGNLILSNGTVRGLIDTYNNFFGLNIGNSPKYTIGMSWPAAEYGLVIGAIMVPLLSALTQWINVKLMPQQPTSNNQENSMAASMRSMNMIMPIFSAWICYTLPCGIGLYWIAGSIVRSIQQVVINKQIDKMDFDELIKKNVEKNAKRMEKLEKQQELLNKYSSMNTRNIQSRVNISTGTDNSSGDSASGNSGSSGNSVSSSAKPGSMMAKANLVKEYNERNNKN